MNLQTNPYQNIFASFSKTSVLVVGDIILDHYIWGRTDRISDEAPVPIVWINKQEDRLGGAANDVRNLLGLGCSVSLLGVVGEDSESERIVNLVRSCGVDASSLIRDPNRPTTVKTRVIARNQQVVRIDREDTTPISFDIEQQLIEYIDRNLEKYDLVILSDYAKGLFSKAFAEKILVWQQESRLGLNQRPLILDPHPSNAHLYKYASVVKPNRSEAEKTTGIKISNIASATEAANLIKKKWNAELVVLSLSEDGMLLVGGDLKEPVHLKTKAHEVADVSGAGDTVTSVFAAAIAAGATVVEAGQLANIAASVVIAEVGTAAISYEKLEAAVLSQR